VEKEYDEHIENVLRYFGDKNTLLHFDISQHTGDDLTTFFNHRGFNFDASHWKLSHAGAKKKAKLASLGPIERIKVEISKYKKLRQFKLERTERESGFKKTKLS
jgi:hypothetical protein